MEPKALRGKPKRRKPTLATSKADGRLRRILRASEVGRDRGGVGSLVEVSLSVCIVVPRVGLVGCLLGVLGCLFDVTPLERRLFRLLDDLDVRGLEGISVLPGVSFAQGVDLRAYSAA
jgi:hypothetical protein